MLKKVYLEKMKQLDNEVEECDEKRITELLENQGSDASFLIEEIWNV